MTIPHTEDTKEMTVEKILKDIDFWKSQERNGHSFDEMNKAVEALKESVRTTLTLYASQVREKWLRDEIVKLEGMKIGAKRDKVEYSFGDHMDYGRDLTLQTIIDSYQEKLTTLNTKDMTDTKHSAELATCDFCRASEVPVRRKYLYRENKEREIGDGFTITRYCHECGLKSENADTNHTDRSNLGQIEKKFDPLSTETQHTDSVEAWREKMYEWCERNCKPGEFHFGSLIQIVYDELATLQAQTSQQVEEAVLQADATGAYHSGYLAGKAEVEEAVRKLSPWLQHDATCFLYLEEGTPDQCDCGLSKALTPNHQD